jgi:hypothetical protein
MYILLQLCLLFVLSVVVASFSTKKEITLPLSILLGIFFSIQIASVLFGGNLIDYKFFVHLNTDLWGLKDFFITQIILILISFAFSAFLIYYLSHKWKSLNLINGRANFFTIPFCLIILSLDGGVFKNIYNVATLNLTPEKEFFQGLADLGIKPSDYTLPEDVKAKPGKNIIVISLESFESGFLSDRFAHLTPNLRKMAKEMTFFGMRPAPGSKWTAGSIYTEISGFPSFFKSKVNENFQKNYGTKVTGVGHILSAAGYDLTYMLAGSEFAGVGDMLRTHKFKVKSDGSFSEKYPLTSWGVHDKDLFNEAKKELLAAKRSNAPFALFMSTVSTHHPNGVYDSRMEGLVDKQESDLEFMAAAVDYLIGDLYEFLKKENMLSNTSIFIFPDHLLMGKASRVLNDFSDPRGLYLLTNAPENKLSYSIKDKLLQIDIPKIILEGAEVKHNGKFLVDFLKNKDKLKFIQQNESNILALNEASLNTKAFRNGISIELTETKELYIKSASYTDTIKSIEGDDVLCEMSFDHNMRLISTSFVRNLKNFQKKHDNTKLLVHIKDDNLYAYLKKGEILGVAKQGAKELSFTKSDIDILSDWDIDSKILPSKPPHNYVAPYNNLVYLTSTGGHNFDREFASTEIRIGSKRFTTKRGVNLLIREGGSYKVENYDTFKNPAETKELIKRLSGLRHSKGFYALVAHDSADKELKEYWKELKNLGFELLTTLNFREAYIAYSYNGFISEYKDGNSLSFSLPQHIESSRSDYQIEKDSKDRHRFIAHAGGKIEGHNYTNSLEALDLSYKKGFRLFELDIIETSDGKYVAAHDWKQWAGQTNYTGSLPVTSSEFMKHKIKGKFTPLDMEAVNKWFSEHKDAILVTDKINKPKAFSDQFVDKNRLMMELFSLDAVKEGLSIGIRSAMPSSNVVNKIEGDKIAFLKELKVKHICVSRREVESNTDFFLKLKDNNIDTYVFHVNFDKGKDEAYAVLHDMDYIYGLYADDWSFGK